MLLSYVIKNGTGDWMAIARQLNRNGDHVRKRYHQKIKQNLTGKVLYCFFMYHLHGIIM
jgi:hypothetical protein